MSAPELSVSTGNSKMGRVVSVSLPPVMTCGRALPCFRGCYAAKLSRLRPAVKAAWERNWKLLMHDRAEYFWQAAGAASGSKAGLFRWHVAGDIPDYDYLRRMKFMALALPKTRFLAFTKKYDLLMLSAWEPLQPDNLTLVASAWPGLEMPEGVAANFPVAYMRDPKRPDPRIPDDAKECDGGCEKCGLCWGLAPGESVVFDKH